MTIDKDAEISRLKNVVIRHKQLLEVYRIEREQFLIILKEYSEKLKNQWFTHE